MTENDASYRIISDLLHAHTGQTLAESRRWRIATALSGLFREFRIGNTDQLACMLENPAEHRLAIKVVEALLNNETYFFRDPAYFQALAEHVLAELARKRAAKKRLSIWSAGCSTGQEALSLAMIFAAQKEQWAEWEVEILGTDISGKAIEQARRGTYSQFEIQRGLSVTRMIEFFTESPGGWQAKDCIQRQTRFERHNILDHPPASAPFDLILCRNVLLYFDPETRRSAFDSMASALAPDGFLMLGAGETVIGQTTRFTPSDCGSATYRLVSGGVLSNSASRDRAAA